MRKNKNTGKHNIRFENYGFSQEINQYYNHYITIADAKAAGVLTLNAVLFTLLLVNDFTSHPLFWLFGLGLVLVIVSAGFALFTIYPRSTGEQKGVVYWENVANFRTAEQYADFIKSYSKDDIEFEYVKQNFYLSSILSKKNKHIRMAMWLLGATLIVVLVLSIIGVDLATVG